MERRVNDTMMIERIVALETKQDNLQSDVKEIKDSVKALTDLASQGKGSLLTLWKIGGLAAAFTSFAAGVAGYVWGGHK